MTGGGEPDQRQIMFFHPCQCTMPDTVTTRLSENLAVTRTASLTTCHAVIAMSWVQREKGLSRYRDSPAAFSTRRVMTEGRTFDKTPPRAGDAALPPRRANARQRRRRRQGNFSALSRAPNYPLEPGGRTAANLFRSHGQRAQAVHCLETSGRVFLQTDKNTHLRVSVRPTKRFVTV